MPTGFYTQGPYDPTTLSKDMLSGDAYVSTTTNTSRGFNGYFCREQYSASFAAGSGWIQTDTNTSLEAGEIGEPNGVLLFADRVAAFAAFVDRTALPDIGVYQRHSTRSATFDVQNSHSTFAQQQNMYRQAMRGVMATLLHKNRNNAVATDGKYKLPTFNSSAGSGGTASASELGFFVPDVTTDFTKAWYAAHDIAMHISSYIALPTIPEASLAWAYIRRGYGVLGDIDGLFFLYEAP